jgi:hypothetical protein
MPSFAVGARRSEATAGRSGVCAEGIAAKARTFWTKAQRIDPEGENLRRSRALVRPLGAPIRSISASIRRWTPGRGGSSTILAAHGRCLAAERRAGAREQLYHAGIWSRRRVGSWPWSKAPSRGCDAPSRRTGPRVGSKAIKGCVIRTNHGHGPAQSRAAPTKDRAIPMHGRAGTTSRRGQ